MKRIVAALVPLLLMCGCAPKSYKTDFFAMDTFMSVIVQGEQAEQAAQQCERHIAELEQALSRTREDSEIWQINHAAGEAAAMPTAGGALLTAMEYARLTDGLYDPTVARLSDLWAIGTENARVPAQDEIDEALQSVGVDKLTAEQGNTFALRGGAQIDLGGIAKGIAADECAAILRQRGNDGLLVLGGNIYAVGANEGEDWVIGIADPENSADYIATLGVQDQSVVTSGDYERFFEQDGRRYHHIFDPRTGYPAQSGLRSVTVIDTDSTRADALTTALFVMGLDKGTAFCVENEVAAVFVTSDKLVYTTPRVDEVCRFLLTGGEKGYTHAR